MKNGRVRTSLKNRFHILTFFGVLILAGAALVVPFYSGASSASSKSTDKPLLSASLSKQTVLARTPEATFAAASPFFVESIATYDDATCSTPKTDFNLGETVCVKATGVPASLFPWQVNWVGPSGFVRESDSAVLDDNNEYRYTLPATANDIVNDQTVDNRGRWRVNLAKANGAIRQTAWFNVHETGNAEANLSVQKILRDAEDTIHSGDNAAFVIVVQNNGPDTAVNAHLVDSIPAGSTLTSFTQNSGPPCTMGGTDDCTIASMANQDRAEFTVVYAINGAPGDYSTSATVSSDTADSSLDNNTSSTNYTIASGSGGGGACELTCPSDITTNANTTEGGERGAHVTFDPAEATGTCGTVTASPASGSFFPVGTTVVMVTSETGDGSCQFTVTVEESNGNVSISCPANVETTANSSCEANVNVGTPTVTGSNVTFHGTRSDGKPMYNCDCFPNSPNQADDACNTNGACTRKTDAPFPSGVTTITWIAYSHDTAGPFNTPEDEEAHRTGSAVCNQTITVNDETPPTITAANITVSADANCQAAVPDYSTIATVSDNCACASSDNSENCQDRQTIVVTQSPAAGDLVGLGPHTITLTANDGSSNNNGAGNSTTIQVTFTVNDTTPPTFTYVPPTVIAYTGPGATTCDTVVSDATLGTATATDNCGPVTVTRSPSGNTFPVGDTTVTWTATDGAGNTTTATQTVTVIDNTVPIITLNGNSPSLWPPNHSYHSFAVTDFVSSVFDNCGGVSVSDVVIQSVTSDEAENGNGDGNTSNDIVIAANCKSVQLRSERSGSSDGRVYTITFRLRDTHNNVTTATATVVVPKNPGQTPVNSGILYTVNGTCP